MPSYANMLAAAAVLAAMSAPALAESSVNPMNMDLGGFNFLAPAFPQSTVAPGDLGSNGGARRDRVGGSHRRRGHVKVTSTAG